MNEKISLCAKIPKELHSRIKDSQVDSGMTLNEFMEYFILNYYEMEEKIEKGEIKMEKTRTLAIQIDEELFERINKFIKEKGLKKKEFLINLIEAAIGDEINQETDFNETEEDTQQETESSEYGEEIDFNETDFNETEEDTQQETETSEYEEEIDQETDFNETEEEIDQDEENNNNILNIDYATNYSN